MQLNLDDIGGARELARYRISAAKDDLEAAELNFKEGHCRSSNNRAYYAVFRAISACLTLEFKAYKQHAQVIGNFLYCINRGRKRAAGNSKRSSRIG